MDELQMIFAHLNRLQARGVCSIEKEGEEGAGGESKPAALTIEEVQKRIDGAFKDSQRRTEKAIRESIAAAVAEALKPAPKDEAAEGEAAKGTKGAESPEYRALLKRVEASEKKQAEAEAARKAEAEGRRSDTAKAELRKHLSGANVRETTLDILVDAFDKRGTLRFDEDGRPVLAVKRARAKGASAEEQLFVSIEDGVKDWAQSPEAAAFLKPSGSTTTTTGGKKTATGTLPKYDKEPASDEEATSRVLELLENASP